MRERGLLVGVVLAAISSACAAGCNLITGADGLTVTGGAGGGGATSSSSASSSGSHASSSSSSSTSASSSSTSAASSAGTTSSGDPYAQYRQDCIDKINALRATKGLSPYQRWTDAEACVDKQATHDESVNKPHDAFNTQNPSCGGYGQNECPGWSASTITACLDQMWAEKDQPGCSGCDACDTFTIFQGNCPNCTFNGSVVCGHYVNMSSKMFTGAACGFSTDGTWEAIDFQ
jgi:hypothetical protein